MLFFLLRIFMFSVYSMSVCIAYILLDSSNVKMQCMKEKKMVNEQTEREREMERKCKNKTKEKCNK